MQAPKRSPHVDVEMPRDERRRRMSSPALMRDVIAGGDQIVGHERVIRIGLFQKMPEAAPRYECVECSRSHHRRIDRHAASVTAHAWRTVETRQSGRLDQHQLRETVRVTRSQYYRIGGAERVCYQDAGSANDLGDKVGYESDVRARGVPDRWPVGPAEAEQVDRVDRVIPGQVIDVVAPLERPGRRMNSMDQEQRRPLAPLGERYPPAAPAPAAFLAAYEIRNPVDAALGVRVIGSR